MKPSELKEQIGYQAKDIILQGLSKKEKSGKILCPYHDDKNPSMSWDKEHNCFKCFACDENMDIYRYYMDFKGMDFAESMEKAAKIINVKIEVHKKSIETKKTFKSARIGYDELTPDAIIFAINRHISEDTLKAWNVKSSVKPSNEWLVFHHYDENNKLVFNTFRSIKSKDFLRQPGTKSILWGINHIDVEKPVLIVEGHCDCLAVWQSGFKNVVSIPSGAKELSWIENCHDWLKVLVRVVVWADNDTPGLKCAETIRSRIGREKCTIEVNPDFKDANEFLKCRGEHDLYKFIEEIMREKVSGLINMSRRKDKTRASTSFYSGFYEVDKHFRKFSGGDLTILFGRDNEGKSTFMSQMLATVLKTQRVFLYSGELTENRIEEWLMRQLVGSDSSMFYTLADEFQNIDYFIKPEAKNKIKKWYEDKFYVYETKVEMSDTNKLFNVMTRGFKKFGIKFFVIDNLMTALDESSSDENKNQTAFVKQCKQFCLAFDTHIIVVAHPNKTGSAEQTPLFKYHISGSKNISNIADNILAVERIWKQDEEANDCYKKKDLSGIYYSALIRSLKDRVGAGRKEFYYHFDPVSNRFYNELTFQNEDYGIFKGGK